MTVLTQTGFFQTIRENPPLPQIFLRDYYAGLVLQGCLATGRSYSTEEMTSYAWEMADAMLVQRNQAGILKDGEK